MAKDMILSSIRVIGAFAVGVRGVSRTHKAVVKVFINLQKEWKL